MRQTKGARSRRAHLHTIQTEPRWRGGGTQTGVKRPLWRGSPYSRGSTSPDAGGAYGIASGPGRVDLRHGGIDR